MASCADGGNLFIKNGKRVIDGKCVGNRNPVIEDGNRATMESATKMDPIIRTNKKTGRKTTSRTSRKTKRRTKKRTGMTTKRGQDEGKEQDRVEDQDAKPRQEKRGRTRTGQRRPIAKRMLPELKQRQILNMPHANTTVDLTSFVDLAHVSTTHGEAKRTNQLQI